jgi:hypothetical protein
MAKLCHENGLTKGPDIVSYIRLSMKCLWQYITSKAQGDHSTAIEQQKKKEEGVEQQQDLNYHAMTAPSSRVAAEAATNTAVMGEHIRESIARTPPPPTRMFNIHEYFQPVFDQLEELNKLADSLIDDKWEEKKK